MQLQKITVAEQRYYLSGRKMATIQQEIEFAHFVSFVLLNTIGYVNAKYVNKTSFSKVLPFKHACRDCILSYGTYALTKDVHFYKHYLE